MFHSVSIQHAIDDLNKALNCMSITQYGWTSLMTAAAYGKCDVLRDLLDSGADINAWDNVSDFHLRLEPVPADIPGYVCVISTCAWNYMCICTLYQKV